MAPEMRHPSHSLPKGVTVWPRDDAEWTMDRVLAKEYPSSRDWRAKIVAGAGSACEGQSFGLTVSFPEDYPFNPPTFTFDESVAGRHPSVDAAGSLQPLPDWAKPVIRGAERMGHADGPMDGWGMPMGRWTPAMTVAKCLGFIKEILQCQACEGADSGDAGPPPAIQAVKVGAYVDSFADDALPTSTPGAEHLSQLPSPLAPSCMSLPSRDGAGRLKLLPAADHEAASRGIELYELFGGVAHTVLCVNPALCKICELQVRSSTPKR